MGNRKVTEAEAQEWKRLYESGLSIEQISLEAGRTRPLVNRWLKKLGTQMRTSPGGNRPPSRMVDGKGSSPSVKVGRSRASYRGHRRRSGGL